MLAAGLVLGSAATFLLSGDRDSAQEQLRFIPFATDPEMEAFPVFSPDGKSIAYIKDFQVFVRALDAATPTQLTQIVVTSSKSLMVASCRGANKNSASDA